MSSWHYCRMDRFRWLVEEIEDNLTVVGEGEDVENTRSISMSSEQAACTSVGQLTGLLDEVRAAFWSSVASERGLPALTFYAWVDHQAGQLRFSVTSLQELPFGTAIEVSDDPERVAQEFLASPYVDGVPWEELEEGEGLEASQSSPGPMLVFATPLGVTTSSEGLRCRDE